MVWHGPNLISRPISQKVHSFFFIASPAFFYLAFAHFPTLDYRGKADAGSIVFVWGKTHSCAPRGALGRAADLLLVYLESVTVLHVELVDVQSARFRGAIAGSSSSPDAIVSLAGRIAIARTPSPPSTTIMR